MEPESLSFGQPKLLWSTSSGARLFDRGDHLLVLRASHGHNVLSSAFQPRAKRRHCLLHEHGIHHAACGVGGMVCPHDRYHVWDKQFVHFVDPCHRGVLGDVSWLHHGLHGLWPDQPWIAHIYVLSGAGGVVRTLALSSTPRHPRKTRPVPPTEHSISIQLDVWSVSIINIFLLVLVGTSILRAPCVHATTEWPEFGL